MYLNNAIREGLASLHKVQAIEHSLFQGTVRSPGKGYTVQPFV
jgi:hypothetical protein